VVGLGGWRRSEPAAAPPALPPAIVDPPRAAPRPTVSVSVDWRSLISGVYALVAGVLLLRLVIGLVLTWRMARAARPIRESWTGGGGGGGGGRVGGAGAPGVARLLAPPDEGAGLRDPT